MKRLCGAGMGLMFLLSLSIAAYADYKDDIGYTMLQAELGISLPDGSGVTVTQVEAISGDSWMPDYTDLQFSGKTMNYHTGETPGIYSAHATSVGKRFFGNTLSIAPGISTIDCYSADYWLESDFIRTGYPGKPLYSASRVANHSWIGHADDADEDSDILRRLDWVIETDEFIQTVGIRNGSVNRPLLCSAFNTIAVGCSDGDHATGSAPVNDSMDDVYLPERTRPDIVIPLNSTSAATPVVASASAMLVGAGHNNTDLSTDPEVLSTTNRNGDTIYNAERSEVIRAVLMAGADRYIINDSGSVITSYRVDPANQTANGLDKRFGAGQLNIYNSYYALFAGEQNSFEDDPSSQGGIGPYGFDYDPSFGGSSGSNDEASYYFTADSRSLILSVSLVWNLYINGGTFSFNGSATLHDLDLFLRDVTDPGNPLLIASSGSSLENTENLRILLENGHDYEIQVTPADGSFEWDYALAWHTFFLESDLDGDGDVGGVDLAAFSDAFGSSVGEPNYNPDADFDGNDAVDEDDLATFAPSFGRTDYP